MKFAEFDWIEAARKKRRRNEKRFVRFSLKVVKTNCFVYVLNFPVIYFFFVWCIRI